MNAVAIIGIDLAKRSFRLHGTDANGTALFRRKISRERLLEFLAGQPMCIVAMEACASAHHWGRAISELGHEVRLLPPIDVKPYVKRQKNDAADAEAIAEAASRPSMRFVALKTPAQQARAMVFRTRDMLVRQRSQSINALRGHLAEHGVIAPRGLTHIGRPAATVENPSVALPDGVGAPSRLLLEQIAWLDGRIADLAKELRLAAADDPEVRRLMTMPGIGPVAAMAIAAFAPRWRASRALDTSRRGPPRSPDRGRCRVGSAGLLAADGIVPRQRSTGGKARLGKTSRMGQRDIRRLLIIGATTVVRWASRNGAPAGSWLARMLARKPKMLVATALANKMARMIWAMGTKHEVYRDPATMAA